MTKIYINWIVEEVLSEEEMLEKHKEMLNLKKDLGKNTFENFLEYECDESAKELIKIITAQGMEEATNLLMLMQRYGEYVENQLNYRYKEFIVD